MAENRRVDEVHRLGVTLAFIQDNGGARPRQLNDKIDEINEIPAFCSAINAVDGEMPIERVD
jgi:hypothetical protein